jgi:N-acetyl-anhydromuramyl-L-alanine amidase AmpD
MKIIDMVGKLKTRPDKSYKKRKIEDVDQIVMHHSATKEGSPEAFANYHVGTLKWPGIGYHYVIDKKGNAYKCNPISNVSYHAAGANYNSIGICLVGNFDIENPTDAQMKTAVELVKEIKQNMRIKRVIGHREVKGTKKSCPGKNFDMNKFRERIGVN